MDDQRLVERFVSVLRLEQNYTHENPPPPEMNAGLDPEDWNAIRWSPLRIRLPAARQQRLESLRYGLQTALPPAYEQLVTGWAWLNARFECVEFFPSPSGSSLDSLVSTMLKEPAFCEHLVSKGVIPFGQSGERFYDPICFDTSRRHADGDCPIVRYEHEAMLSFGRIGDVEELWPSFRSMMEVAAVSQPR